MILLLLAEFHHFLLQWPDFLLQHSKEVHMVNCTVFHSLLRLNLTFRLEKRGKKAMGKLETYFIVMLLSIRLVGINVKLALTGKWLLINH